MRPWMSSNGLLESKSRWNYFLSFTTTQSHGRSAKRAFLTNVTQTSSPLTEESATCALSFTRLQPIVTDFDTRPHRANFLLPACVFPLILHIEFPSSDLIQTPTQPKATTPPTAMLHQSTTACTLPVLLLNQRLSRILPDIAFSFLLTTVFMP